MKFLDLALLAGAAWLIFGNKGATAAADTGGFSGFSGATLPGTQLPTSVKLQEVIKKTQVTPAALVKIATQQDLGKITVTQPARNAAGLTAWDIRIRENFAAQGKPYPYKN